MTLIFFFWGGGGGEEVRWKTVRTYGKILATPLIPHDICTRFGRYLFSTKCSWIIKLKRPLFAMKSFNMHALSKHAAEQHHGLSHKFAAWVRVGGDRFYYMASSVSGQTKSSYPTGQDGAILPAQDYPPCPTKKNSQKPY